jgi:hypothetical protein
MAHKNKVVVTNEWSDLLASIQDYSSSSEYNIQVLSQGKVCFCLSTIEPTTQSYTVVDQYQIVSLTALCIGCWVKTADSASISLSIEEIPAIV